MEVIRKEVKRTTVPGKLSSAIDSGQLVNNTDKDDAAAVWTKIDIRSAEVCGNRRTETAGAVDARVEDSDLNPVHTKTRVVNNRGREHMSVAHCESLGVAKLIAG